MSNAATSRETATVEIPGSPLSRHDIDVIRFALNAARAAGYVVTEIQVSERRLAEDGLRLFGLPVRRTPLDLHGALLVCDGRTPITFDLEETL